MFVDLTRVEFLRLGRTHYLPIGPYSLGHKGISKSSPHWPNFWRNPALQLQMHAESLDVHSQASSDCQPSTVLESTSHIVFLSEVRNILLCKPKWYAQYISNILNCDTSVPSIQLTSMLWFSWMTNADGRPLTPWLICNFGSSWTCLQPTPQIANVHYHVTIMNILQPDSLRRATNFHEKFNNRFPF